MREWEGWEVYRGLAAQKRTKPARNSKPACDDALIPTESQEQQALFQWAAKKQGRYPELALLHHIPNGGARNAATGRRLKAEGVKAGVPDICLPVPRGGFHGLYIELKRIKRSRVDEEQRRWLEGLAAQGYCVAICKGSEAAERTIEEYLEMEEKNDGR